MPNFLALKQRVQTYVQDLPSETVAEIPSWINKAMRTAMRLSNFRSMRKLVEITTTTGELPADRVLITDLFSSAAIPAGVGFHYKSQTQERGYFFDQYGDATFLDWADIEDMIKMHSIGSTDLPNIPKYLSVDTQQETQALKVFPTPDTKGPETAGAYKIHVPLVGFLDDLAADGDENWFTTYGEWYLTYYATAEAMFFNRDEEQALVYARKAGVDVTTGDAILTGRGRFTGELGEIVKLDKRNIRPSMRTMNFSFDAGARP